MSSPKSSNWTLALLALGVVYGDIGTSPIYALRECLAHSGFDVRTDIPDLLIIGPVSLMIWSLTIIVTLKYLLVVSRADNQGEGGVFALYSLLRSQRAGLSKRTIGVLTLLALFGASLLYGDGIITPAISVLSAVEGLKELWPSQDLGWIIPITAAVILLGLFLCQKHGTGNIGRGFGPIMMIWFLLLAFVGVYHLIGKPGILWAFAPHYGWMYLWVERGNAVHIMGTVLLAVTGCEALYADIGHFGRLAMNRSWFCIAYPALLLNYLGQGALILKDHSAWSSPFYRMAPPGFLLPMVIMATLATIIASQAMITGVFSLTQQAVQLGFMPRLKIVHTSSDVKGQVYLPQINALLMFACLALVLGFRNSSSLANAYGLSVASDMLLTTSLMFLLVTHLWNWPFWKAAFVCGLFMSLEGGYFVGALSKFADGAWFTLLVALCAWILMKTWRDGRAILIKRVVRSIIPTTHIIDELKKGKIYRVPGIGVFLTSSSEGLPLVLLHHLKHNKVLHATAVLLTVKFEEEPFIPEERRVEIKDLYEGNFFRVILHYGFADSPEVMRDFCATLKDRGMSKLGDISFYQSRELLLTDGTGKMATWRKKLFVFLSRISRPATGYFHLPSRQVIELGIQLEL